MATSNIITALRIVVCIIAAYPTVCLSEVSLGYDAYVEWQNWPRLRSDVRAGLASSYDRTGGNYDFSYYEDPCGIRTANEMVTIKTIQGPGVIYRFWMPHVMADRDFIIRMYFDGEQTPSIDTNSIALLGGTFNYFTPPLVDIFAGGQVCYEPIPFETSVRIESENKALPNHPGYNTNRHYYQYSYLTFPPSTKLDSYTGSLTTQQQTARSAMVSLFENAGVHPAGSSPTAIDVNTPAVVIGSGSEIILADLIGPAIIRRLNIKMDDANDAELDGLRLRVYYDSNDVPSIDVSVGNFFGAGKGRVAYKSIPLGTDSAEGFYCYWPMPFRDSVLVKLCNTADFDIPINSAELEYEPNANVEKLCYLHVLENNAVRQSGQIYHPILSTTGCGHYVGNLLYIEQQSYSFYMLEGDEVITVDGTTVLNGTGLEDAYNGGHYYNWVAARVDEPEGAYPQSAFRPLYGILYVHRQQSPDYARADQYRWQIADCVPFSQSIDVKIENRYAIVGSEWTSVAFWYQYSCLDTDFDDNCRVDLADFAVLGSYWQKDNCENSGWCNGTDLDKSGDVGIEDVAAWLKDWL